MPGSALINVMIAAARKAARHLVRDFGEVEQLQVSRKGPADFVSNADKHAEKILHEELARARPGYGFLLEERGEVPGKDKTHRWIIDPLDGTTNFLHGIPLFSISIALEREGKLVAGLVYNPISDELFTAERGQGAFFNDRRIRVAVRQDLAQSVIGTGVPHMARGDYPRFTRQLNNIMPQVAGIRRTGSAAIDLAWLAAGRFDGFWEHDLSPWDMAAGIVLIREAGGRVTDMNGGEKMFTTGSIAAANEKLHGPMLKMLKA